MSGAAQRATLGAFLRARRARLSPEALGLPGGGRRRTPGLRREEVALLAGIGVDWYTWLEQGRPIGVSAGVLDSIARTLRLDAAETAYLHELAREQLPQVPYDAPQTVPPTAQQVLDAFATYPACVVNACWDVLAWNVACCRVFGDYSARTGRERNTIWRIFFDPSWRALIVDWEREARKAVAIFRYNTRHYVGLPWYDAFVADLQHGSPMFAAAWQHHDLQVQHDARKVLDHPQVGRLVIQPTTLQLVDAPALRLIVDLPLPDEDTPQKLAALVAQGT
jgi:transcriptional regulator with XRE-family HTH domain